MREGRECGSCAGGMDVSFRVRTRRSVVEAEDDMLAEMDRIYLKVDIDLCG